MTLSWTAPLAASVTSYRLEAGSAAGLSDLASVPTGSTATSFSTSGVAPGTYYMRAKAISGIATSGPSNEVMVIVGSGPCTAAPGVPTGLVSSVSGHAVTLNWQASDSGCPATAYVVEAGSAPGLSNLAAFPTGNAATTFATTGVPSGIITCGSGRRTAPSRAVRQATRL